MSLSSHELLGIRLCIASITMLIVIAARAGGGFREAVDFISVGVPLLPVLIYAVGAKTDVAVKSHGSIILALAAFTWLPFALTGEPFWLLTLIPTTIASFVIAVLAVTDKRDKSKDELSSRRPWWDPTG